MKAPPISPPFPPGLPFPERRGEGRKRLADPKYPPRRSSSTAASPKPRSPLAVRLQGSASPSPRLKEEKKGNKGRRAELAQRSGPGAGGGRRRGSPTPKNRHSGTPGTNCRARTLDALSRTGTRRSAIYICIYVDDRPA